MKKKRFTYLDLLLIFLLGIFLSASGCFLGLLYLQCTCQIP